MSKMSNIAIELDEKAVELGFADHLEAMANGYDWGVGEDGVAFLFKMEDEQEKAHEAWLKERDMLCYELEMLISDTPYKIYEETLTKAVKFLREECHD